MIDEIKSLNENELLLVSSCDSNQKCIIGNNTTIADCSFYRLGNKNDKEFPYRVFDSKLNEEKGFSVDNFLCDLNSKLDCATLLQREFDKRNFSIAGTKKIDIKKTFICRLEL